MNVPNTDLYHFFHRRWHTFRTEARGGFGFDTHSRGMEVETMFQSMAEVTFQQGIEQGETRAKQMVLLKLLHHRFQSVPEAIRIQIHALRSPSHLDTLFEKALNAENLEDIDWANF